MEQLKPDNSLRSQRNPEYTSHPQLIIKWCNLLFNTLNYSIDNRSQHTAVRQLGAILIINTHKTTGIKPPSDADLNFTIAPRRKKSVISQRKISPNSKALAAIAQAWIFTIAQSDLRIMRSSRQIAFPCAVRGTTSAVRHALSLRAPERKRETTRLDRPQDIGFLYRCNELRGYIYVGFAFYRYSRCSKPGTTSNYGLVRWQNCTTSSPCNVINFTSNVWLKLCFNSIL